LTGFDDELSDNAARVAEVVSDDEGAGGKVKSEFELFKDASEIEAEAVWLVLVVEECDDEPK